jgi:hypothetical protein
MTILLGAADRNVHLTLSTLKGDRSRSPTAAWFLAVEKSPFHSSTLVKADDLSDE